jgi:hypothetical protein
MYDNIEYVSQKNYHLCASSINMMIWENIKAGKLNISSYVFLIKVIY